MKFKWYVGSDFSKSDDLNTQTVMRRNDNGTFTIIGIYSWKTSIDLPKDEYRIKDTTAPAQ